MARAVAAIRRRRAPGPSRRDQLLDEAARQLNARGFTLTSLTDVADQLGVSRAALYYYVDDREDLVFQVYRRSCEILARRLGEAARPGRKALDVVGEFIARSLDPGEAELAALSELGLLRSAERETVLGLYEAVVARLARVLEAGARAGEIRRCDYAIAARCIISLIYWAPLAPRWTMAVPPVERRQVIALVNDFLARGLASDRARRVDPPRIDLSPLLAPKVAAFDRSALAQARRETILLTASRMFNAKGVDTTSLDEIAAELGATKRTLYRYVGDKQALVSACYDRAFRIYFFVARSAREMGLGTEESSVATARAQAVAQQRMDICPLRPLVGFEGLNPGQRARVEALSRELSAISTRRMATDIDDGTMRPLELQLMLLVLPGLTTWLAKDLVEADAARQIEIGDEVAELMRIGLAPVGP